ncbi:MAG: hypothetical protein Q9183_003425, partial [Haloplaca sp. 2 TL-2023]
SEQERGGAAASVVVRMLLELDQPAQILGDLTFKLSDDSNKRLLKPLTEFQSELERFLARLLIASEKGTIVPYQIEPALIE